MAHGISLPFKRDPNGIPFATIGNFTAFEELTTAEFTPQIELSSSNGFSAYRDITTFTGSGSISETAGQFRLSTGATGGSTAELRTVERGRYQPGISAVAGIAFARPTAPDGNKSYRVGLFDENDGFIVGEDADGVFLERRKGGTTVEKVYQENWNNDRLTGKGPSELTLDPHSMSIFRVDYLWYGSGPAQMGFVVSGQDGRPYNITAHYFTSDEDQMIVEEPNLPINAEVDNGGDAEDQQVYIGGRHYAVIGRYQPNRRITSETVFEKSLDGTTIVPLISFRRKSTDLSKSVKVEGVSALPLDNVQLLIILDGTLTGASFGSFTNIDPNETALEVDTAATGISGGNAIYETLASSGGGNKVDLSGIEGLGLEIPTEQSITIAARKVSGTGGTASVTFRAEEEW